MGYQESFVTTRDKNHFYRFLSRIRELGKEYYDYYGAKPVFIVTVKKDVLGVECPLDLDDMSTDDISGIIKLRAGEKYVYFTGERYLQRSPFKLVNAMHPADAIWSDEKALVELSYTLESVFVEEIDGEQIFASIENPQTAIYDGLNNEWIRVEKMLWSTKEVREKAHAFLAKHLDYPLNAPASDWDSKDFCLTAISLKNIALRCVPRKFWKDHDFCLAAVKRNGQALEWIHDNVITEEMCLIAIKQYPDALGAVPKRFLSEPLILEAINRNGTALYYVPRMQLTKKIIVSAVRQNKNALQYVPDEWREEAKEAMKDVK